MYDSTNQYGFFIKVNGKRVTEYSHTDGNVYLEGRPKTEYELELVNDSYDRVVMIPSVDGLSVIDGKTAGLDSDGYVVDALSKVSVPGWTLDGDSVAKFVFESAKSSYTNRSGNGTNNVGALGVLVFREWQPVNLTRNFTYTSMDPTWNSSGGSMLSGGTILGSSAGDVDLNMGVKGSGSINMVETSCSTLSSNTSDDASISLNASATPLGTGFGDAADFGTTQINFTKRDDQHPDAMLAVYYDSGKGLERKGIVLEHKTATVPSAFPKYDNSPKANTSCEPPADWEPVDRDNLVEKLLGKLKKETDRDTMYDLLKHVATEGIEEAFKSYKKTLKL